MEYERRINKRWSDSYKQLEENPSNDLKSRIKKVLIDEPLTLTEIARKLKYKSIPNSLRQAMNTLLEDRQIEKIGKKYKNAN